MAGRSVFSPRLPAPLEAGRTKPLAPGLGVLRDLADLRHIAELVGLACLALADRPRVGIGDRDDAACDLLAEQALGRLLCDPFAALGQLLDLARGPQLCLRAAPAGLRARRLGKPPGLFGRAVQEAPGLGVQGNHLLARLPRSAGKGARDLAHPPCRASALAPCRQSIPSEG